MGAQGAQWGTVELTLKVTVAQVWKDLGQPATVLLKGEQEPMGGSEPRKTCHQVTASWGVLFTERLAPSPLSLSRRDKCCHQLHFAGGSWLQEAR